MSSEGNRKGQQPARGSSPGSRYAIRVEGLLDAHWSEWLNGMTLTHEEGGVTRLEGRPGELLERPDFEELFLGAGPVPPTGTSVG